jgi:hypothetical protein
VRHGSHLGTAYTIALALGARKTSHLYCICGAHLAPLPHAKPTLCGKYVKLVVTPHHNKTTSKGDILGQQRRKHTPLPQALHIMLLKVHAIGGHQKSVIVYSNKYVRPISFFPHIAITILQRSILVASMFRCSNICQRRRKS